VIRRIIPRVLKSSLRKSQQIDQRKKAIKATVRYIGEKGRLRFITRKLASRAAK
jgi:hypothetical protein